MSTEIPQTRAGDIAYGLARGILPQSPSRAIAGFVDKVLTPPQQGQPGDFYFSQRDAQIAQIQEQRARERAQSQASEDRFARQIPLTREQLGNGHKGDLSSLRDASNDTRTQFVIEGLKDIPNQVREAAKRVRDSLQNP